MEHIDLSRFQDKKLILDVTCGGRSIWFQKDNKHTVFCDKRTEHFEQRFGNDLNKDGRQKLRTIDVSPDVVCDFTCLPFDDESVYLVVFDPPHIENLSDNSWVKKRYGSLDGDWKPMIRDGFKECKRVLKPNGVIIFKWAETSVSTREIINVIGESPLFGHRSGKKATTHWLCFMKIPEGV